MSEPRKNHLSIDGGQVKEDDHVASYKAIPESDTDFRTSKSSLGKSKEKVSPDGAEEKLLSKDDEAKIVRVDMADAKYVVGDHRNGDAKIELDANKRQFSGLTKEELMKYADDPFWVNLRWCMFVLFWTLWLAMLAGAITIIVRAPKCAPPTPRAWFDKYPLVESEGRSYSELEEQFGAMKSSLVQGVFVEVPTYEPSTDVLEQFKAFAAKAKENGVNVIVDLVANYVPITHPWFEQSVNRSEVYGDYFIWANGTEFDEAGNPKPPNNWVSVYNTSAWSYSAGRREFYLHQYKADQPDLNFDNERVVQEFQKSMKTWLDAGAQGIRLNKARELLVNASLPEEVEAAGAGRALDADHTTYPYWRHQHTSDQPRLDRLLARLARAVREDGVFTVREEGPRAELFLLARNVSALRPASAAPLAVRRAAPAAHSLAARLRARWPLLQLTGPAGSEQELALFALLLPATPVFTLPQILRDDNDTTLQELSVVRTDASIEHGNHSVLAVPAGAAPDALLACARWKAGHTGFVAVFNPSTEPLRANLTGAPSLPATLTVHAASPAVRALTNYTKNYVEQADNVLVPGLSTVVLSYVPQTAAES